MSSRVLSEVVEAALHYVIEELSLWNEFVPTNNFMSGISLSELGGDALGYVDGELSITVLGGVRLEGLDRMRVTLKIEVRSGRRIVTWLTRS